MSEQARTKPRVSIVLTREARRFASELAEERGLSVSTLVEVLIREAAAARLAAREPQA